MTITYNELKRGVKIILNNQPYEIIEASPLSKGRGHSVLQAKIKNLITGNVVSRTFRSSDSFEETELSKVRIKYLYSYRGRYFFCEEKNPSKRFDLTKEQIGVQTKFLKQNQIIEGIFFENKVINISLPIKISLKVIVSPPGIKGGRAEPGRKTVTLETKARVNVPLFIKEGDIIEINTETGEYVRRISTT